MSRMADPSCPFASRGGLKLAAALEAFAVDPHACVCADLGCSVGGFTDCLLQHGAARVFAVDTAYGQLAWKLRQDPKVTVLERTNALYADPWTALPQFPGCDLVVIDLGWTPQRLALPAARRWLKKIPPAPSAAAPNLILSLIKPHYEDSAAATSHRRGGILDEASAQAITQKVLADLPALGFLQRGLIRSPILGGGSRGRRGNVEFLALLEPAAAPLSSPS
ncbi:MAG: hypothetical protein IT443_01645 [Phycisphaeraceae bacterium]|nr:hypothetical protein [Phycisphaeraceae bacterium]